MSNLPFTVFDFFAYLVPGAILLAAFDYALNNQYFTGELLKGSLPAALAIILLIVAYVLGQINDTPARAVLNNELVKHVLWQPSRALFDPRPGWKRLNWLLSDYFVMLPQDIRDEVDKRAGIGRGDGLSEDDKAGIRFTNALGTVLLDKDSAARLSILETQYSFCRNLSFALFSMAFWLLIKGPTHQLPQPGLGLLAFGAIAGGVFMVGRFLRFYRQHAVELFVTFAREPLSSAAK